MQNERVKRARLDKLSRQVPPWVAGILVCLLLTAFRGPDASAQTSAPSTNSPPNGALISFELIRGHIVVTGISRTITISCGAFGALGITFSAKRAGTSTVYPSADVIDTWVYREGLGGAMYSLGVAVSMLKALIGFFLIITSYKLASRFAGYRIF